MKVSYYNFYHALKEGDVIAFNARNCALAELNQEYMDVIRKMENGESDFSEDEKKIINELNEAGFLIDDSVDELENLKYKHNSEKYNKEFMSITIAPTMECNFACKYCFEERKPGIISDSVKKHFLTFLENNLSEGNLLEINWYGGEPLLAIDTIEDLAKKISALLKVKKCQFRQNMVSNGYLIDTDMARRLKNMGVEAIQVTLDGTKEIHDSRRVLKDGKTGSFDRIIKGIKAAILADLEVVIRINIDKINYLEMYTFLLCLKENNINNVKIAFGHVLPYTNTCKEYSDKCFTKSEYSDVVLKIQELMIQEEFKNESVIYPAPKLTYCCACNVNSFLLDVDGDMYKCWCDVGNKREAFANIEDYDSIKDDDQSVNLLKWINRSPFEDSECVKCKLLPICMGGCPKMGQQHPDGKCCDIWKYNIKNMMECTYNYYCN